MSYELISLMQWPSMPAPWSSSDSGEAWVWGDYVMLLQTKPMLVAKMLSKVTGNISNQKSPLSYLFAMTVFYRKDRNPHGPSGRPVLVATLEQMDYSVEAVGVDLSEILSGGGAPIVKGLFDAKTRSNLGNFTEVLTRDSARKYFFDLIGRRLLLEGEPTNIGTIADVHGHPDTGWPAKEKNTSKGCLPVVAVFLLLLALPLAIWPFLN